MKTKETKMKESKELLNDIAKKMEISKEDAKIQMNSVILKTNEILKKADYIDYEDYLEKKFEFLYENDRQYVIYKNKRIVDIENEKVYDFSIEAMDHKFDEFGNLVSPTLRFSLEDEHTGEDHIYDFGDEDMQDSYIDYEHDYILTAVYASVLCPITEYLESFNKFKKDYDDNLEDLKEAEGEKTSAYCENRYGKRYVT